MTALDPTAPAPQAMPGVLRLAPTLFAATLFLSALLLFAVQPMFTKMVLPRLGGAPTVWSVAMVFFQAALLAGYAYAHLLVRHLSFGLGALIHLGVLAAAATTLPIGIAHGFGAPPATDIALWLVGLFAASIGLPFAVLAASAPLLQGWFAATGHPRAGNPYVLYAASNLGSFAALIAYPVVIEPLLPLKAQAQLWSAGFAVLAVAIAAASLFVVHRPPLADAETAAASVSGRERLSWLALAAIPAGLVIAVTAYITTDVAAAPFLWVVPLALYLLTFVAVFRDRPWIAPATVARLAPILVAPLAIGLLGGDKLFWLAMIGVNLVAFVLLALLCHGELYRRRPAPARLTEFYLWTSLGGVLGGIFAALIAPHIFNGVYEYPILIAAAVLVLPGMFAGGVRRFLADAGPILAVAAVAVAAQLAFDVRLPAAAELPFQVALVALAAVMLLQRHRPPRFFALVVLAFVVTALWQPGFRRVESARSFFGVHRVIETADDGYRLLYHGTTLHGAERIRAGGQRADAAPEPLTYYYFGGPMSEAIEAVRAARGGLPRVAAVGLGTGSLACHKRAQEDLDLLRDRRRRGPHRPRSAPVQLHLGLRARSSGRPRRCALDARGLGAAFRSDHPRRLLVRCDSGAPAHARGAGRLPGTPRAAWRAGPAHFQSAHGAGPRGRGSGAPPTGWSPTSRRTAGPTSFRPISRPMRWSPRSRATRPISATCRDDRDGGSSSPIRMSRPGPTTIPTSSGRSCAGSSRADAQGYLPSRRNPSIVVNGWVSREIRSMLLATSRTIGFLIEQVHREWHDKRTVAAYRPVVVGSHDRRRAGTDPGDVSGGRQWADQFRAAVEEYRVHIHPAGRDDGLPAVRWRPRAVVRSHRAAIRSSRAHPETGSTVRQCGGSRLL